MTRYPITVERLGLLLVFWGGVSVGTYAMELGASGSDVRLPVILVVAAAAWNNYARWKRGLDR